MTPEHAVSEARRPIAAAYEADRQRGLQKTADAILLRHRGDRQAAAGVVRSWGAQPGGDSRWIEVANLIEKGDTA